MAFSGQWEIAVYGRIGEAERKEFVVQDVGREKRGVFRNAGEGGWIGLGCRSIIFSNENFHHCLLQSPARGLPGGTGRDAGNNEPL
jgi:hypothetical protein